MITKVGIKLCGNCNPIIDAKRLVEILYEITPNEFVSYEEYSYELLLVINSCAVACAKYENHGSKCLIVNGSDFMETHFQEEKALAVRIGEEIRGYLCRGI